MNKNFFYIDSLNFDEVQNKCYGFNIGIENNEITFNYTGNESLGGSYINIKKENDKIKIINDEFSSLYIFYYIEDSFYAISNNFYKLCEELKKNNKNITINKIFIQQYLQSPLHVHSLYNTLINEVKILPIFTDIELTKDNLKFIKKDIKLQSIDILSEEGNNIINNWINKWSNIIYSISLSNLPFQIDLSGGFDSRIIFSLAYYCGIDLNKENIKVYSKIGDTKGLKEHLGDDYSIATEISNKLNFKLNKEYTDNLNSVNYSSIEQYEILKGCFMGFHKEGYLCTKYYNTPLIHLGGINGEVIRGSLPSEEKLKTRFTNNPIKNDNIVLKEFYNDMKLLEKETDTYFEALTKFFLSNQCRNHFGMSVYNDYIGNRYLISPFNDSELLKLKFSEKYNKDLIFAIIIYKTCPEIFDINFAHNQSFSEETKKVAIEISNKYPLNKNILKYNFNKEKFFNNVKDNSDKYNGEYVLYNIFKENKELFIREMSKLFNKEYAEKLYDYADEFYLNKDNFFPNKWITCLTSIIEILKIQKGLN